MVKKNVLDAYYASPDSEKVKIYLSGVYLLLSLQLQWVEAEDEIMHKYHVIATDFKQYWNRMLKDMDLFEKNMRLTISPEKKNPFMEDYDKIQEIMTNFIFGGELSDGKEE